MVIGNPIIQVDGTSAKFTETIGDTIIFQFKGVKARFYGNKSPYLGKAEIYIDNALVSTIDSYENFEVTNSLLYETPLLPNRTHTLKIENIADKNPLNISDKNEIVINGFEHQASASLDGILYLSNDTDVKKFLATINLSSD